MPKRRTNRTTRKSLRFESLEDRRLLAAISISDSTVTEGDDAARLIDVPISAASSPINDPRSITQGPDGDFYVTSAATASVLRYDGTTFEFKGEFVSPGSGGLEVPVDLVFANGDLFVSTRDSAPVLRYDGDTGSFLGQFVPLGAQGLQRPADLLVHNDQLYVAAWWSSDVHRYDLKTGAFIDKFVETGAGGLDDQTAIFTWRTARTAGQRACSVLTV
jgi:hypothetical protein